MATIEQTVRYLRSKNAGPFWLTVDAFCKNVEDTRKIARTLMDSKMAVAEMFQVKPEEIRIFELPDIQVVKLSFPRRPPEGSRSEKDMHGGQQYVSLLDLKVAE